MQTGNDRHLLRLMINVRPAFHGGIDEVALQISRVRQQAGDIRAVDDQRYLRRGAVGITRAKFGDNGREPRLQFLLVAPARRSGPDGAYPETPSPD